MMHFYANYKEHDRLQMVKIMKAYRTKDQTIRAKNGLLYKIGSIETVTGLGWDVWATKVSEQ